MVVASRHSVNSNAGSALKFPIGPCERHHDARGTTGKIGRLVKIGRRIPQRGGIGNELLLEAERIAAVLIVAAAAAELAVAALAITRDGGMVCVVHFEPHQPASARHGRGFSGIEQHGCHSAPAGMGRDRDGVEACDRGMIPEQHDRRARKSTVLSGHEHLGAVRSQEAQQAAPRQPVSCKHLVFQVQQRIDVAALGLANVDFGSGGAGKIGGHRRHISTFDVIQYLLLMNPLLCDL